VQEYFRVIGCGEKAGKKKKGKRKNSKKEEKIQKT